MTATNNKTEWGPEPLDIPRREINRDFIIRIYPSLNGKGNNSLVGVQGLVDQIGEELANKLVRKAYDKRLQVFRAKLRRGITVEFASH